MTNFSLEIKTEVMQTLEMLQTPTLMIHYNCALWKNFSYEQPYSEVESIDEKTSKVECDLLRHVGISDRQHIHKGTDIDTKIHTHTRMFTYTFTYTVVRPAMNQALAEICGWL